MQEDYTDISVVLDRSGSMISVVTDTIGGFNTFIDEQKKQPGKALLTLAQFDTIYEIVHDGKAIKDVPLLTNETFVPRGGTALLDAIGNTINRTGKRLSDMPENERPGKVIVVILTDGEENSSREFTSSKISDLITLQRDTYKWEFVFLGANQDAIMTASQMGIPMASSMTYAANSQGTQHAFASVSNMTSSYRAGGKAAFSQSDRDKQAKSGA
jgi:hypothetical protein